MARNRKNGRFSTQRRTRRTKQSIKVSTVAQQLIIANAVTRGFAGTNLLPFLTEGWLTEPTTAYVYGSGNSWTFSAAEIVKGLTGQGWGMSEEWQGYGLRKAVETNLKNNGMAMLGTVIGVPIAFNVAKKLLNKPIILPANRMLKKAGIKEVKL